MRNDVKNFKQLYYSTKKELDSRSEIHESSMKAAVIINDMLIVALDDMLNGREPSPLTVRVFDPLTGIKGVEDSRARLENMELNRALQNPAD